MIDIHCHILPGIDDGSQDFDISLKMARIAAADNITTIIATPHVGDNHLPRAKIIALVQALNAALEQEQIDILILPGAEIQSHWALNLCHEHCLADSPYLLLEFPHSYLPGDALDIIFSLLEQNKKVILAHPERNFAIYSDPRKIIPLIEAGAKVQITAESLIGKQGPDVRNCANYLLKNKMVHYLATDSHSPNFRKPCLSNALKKAEKILGRREAIKLVKDNPEKILHRK